jgi:hypothetical protein
MGCTDPVRQCLDWHFRPHLAHAVLEEGGSRVRARCPSCGSLRALTISPKTDGRPGVMTQCFHHCPWPDLRAALRSAGVPDGCLPALGREAEREASQAIEALLQQGTPPTRTQMILRIYLINGGHVRWPRGAELLKLAGECGVSKTEAYEARKTGPLWPSPRNTIPRA